MSDRFDTAYKLHRNWITSKGKSGEQLIIKHKFKKPNFHTYDNRIIHVEGCDIAEDGVSVEDTFGKILSNLDLEGVDFSGYSFRDMELSNISFKNAILERASFSKCSLDKFSFEGANLLGVRIVDSSFSDCRFTSTNLTGIEVTGSYFKNSSFENTDVSRSAFESSEIIENKFYKTNFSNSRLLATNLTNNSINKSDFRGISGNNINFTGCGLVDHIFDSCSLENFSFRKSFGIGISWVNSKLSKGSFEECRISAADMSGGSIKDVVYSFCDLNYSSLIDRVTYDQRWDTKENKWKKFKYVQPISLLNVKFISSSLSEIRVQKSILTEITKSQSVLKYRGTFTVINEGEKVQFYRVFICHAHEDDEVAREIFDYLCKEPDMNPWLDKISLLPGQHWEKEIPTAIRSSDVVIVLMSEKSMSKRGYVQREVKLALDVLNEIPEGEIFIVPIKLDRCEVQGQLGKFQWVEYKDTENMENVLRSIRSKELFTHLT